MSRVDRAVRLWALLGGGALMVHEVRYVLGFGSRADGALAAHGHGYLAYVAPVVGILLALALAVFLSRLATVREPAPRHAVARAWALASISLLVIYSLQELLEGALLTGHPAGIAGVLGNGGWTAAPVAVVIGAVVACLLRGADAAITVAARRRAGRRHGARHASRSPRRPRPGRVAVPARSGIAWLWGERAPPGVRTAHQCTRS